VNGYGRFYWVGIDRFFHWYEEIDIFEPNACEVLDGTHQVGFWHEIDEYDSSSTQNRYKYRGYSIRTNNGKYIKY